MSVTSKVESTISNTSFKLTAFLTSLTVLFFYPDAVDPFNSVKMWLLILGTSWLFGYLVHFGMKSLKNRNSNEKSSLFLFLVLVFILFQTIALIMTKSFYTGFFGEYMRRNGYISYLCLAVITMVSYLSFQRGHFKFIFKIFLFTAIVETAYGTLQHFGKDFIKWLNQYNPIIGTLGNPNFSSAVFSILCTFIFCYTISSKIKSLWKIFLLVFSLFMMLVILWTQAKQGLLSLIFGLGIFAILYFYLNSRKILFLVVPTFLAGSILGILGMLRMGPLQDFLYKDSVSLRGYYWRAGINMFKNNFFGVGLDSYGDYFKQYREKNYAYTRGFDITSTNAHNTFIQHFATGGFFVGISYLLILLLVVIQIVKIIKITEKREALNVSVLAATLAAFHAQSLVSIDNVGISVLGWFLTGSTLGYIENLKRASEKVHRDPNKTNKKVREQVSLVQIVVSFVLLVSAIVLVSNLYRTESEFVKINNFKPTNDSEKNWYQNQLNQVEKMKFLEPSLKVAIAFKFANINNYEQSILILNNVLNERSEEHTSELQSH